MVNHSTRWFSKMKVFTATLLLIMLQGSCAVSPTDCNDTEPVAENAVDQINKLRRDGYLFQLLRVADAHLDRAGPATVYYLALDVKESDCWILYRKISDDCKPSDSRRPSDIVIGQCKVVATRYSNESQDLRVNDFNCTTSSVSSALANTKDSPVILDFFEDTELYRKQAEKALDRYKEENNDFASFRVDQVEKVIRARGGERTVYYVDFSVRNCSIDHFHRYPKVFGFCRADLIYNVEPSDLENPEDLDVNCEVFDFEEHRNFSGKRPHWGHPHHSGGHGHFAGKHPFKPNGNRGHHHPHKPHGFGCPPSPEEKEGASSPSPPSGSRLHHPPFGSNETHRHHHNHSSGDHHPHGPPPHGPPPHGHHPHARYPHGPPPHVPPPHGPHHHRPHHHGPPPHGPPPHGPHHHGPHHHGPPPHGPPPHDFHDHGPCDPTPHSQGPQGDHGHGSPHKHSRKRGPGKGHFPFHWKQTGSVYRLPPLNTGEVLPLPEANFPSFSPECNSKPTIQPFPQSASESCPGKFNSEFSHISKFFAYTFP